METALTLLTRNGSVYMRFRPTLSAAQYAELLEITKWAEEQDQLRAMIRAWADARRLNLCFDE
jgi:hypothetical protein